MPGTANKSNEVPPHRVCSLVSEQINKIKTDFAKGRDGNKWDTDEIGSG